MSETQDPTLRRPPPAGPPADLPEGMEVGEYRVQRKIGEGGMGAVYAAVHPVIGKQVAIKVLSPHLASRADLVERFVAEARSVNRIGHPNIVDIFSFGWLPGDRHYFVMEYLAGQSLHAWMKKRPIDIPETRRLLGQVCGALEAAHQAGIVHRDLKPDNIWVAQPRHGDSFAKLLDFGIAKLMDEAESMRTQTGMIMGTPAYMSPEQCQGVGVGARADIYALGVILYEIFAGRLPFQGSFAELFAQHLTATPQPPSLFVPLPPALDRLILACLEKSPELRPASAAALAFELDDALRALAEGYTPDFKPLPLAPTSELPAASPPPATNEIPAPSVGVRRARAATLATLGVAVALLGGVAIKRALTSDADGQAGKPAAPPPESVGQARVRVVIRNADSARVLIDGRVVASGIREADVPNVAADRPHLLRVEAPGKVPHERKFTVAAGAVVELQVALDGAAPTTPAPAPAPTKPAVSPAPAHPTAQHAPRPPSPAPKPAPPKPGRHRDGLVGEDIFDKP